MSRSSGSPRFSVGVDFGTAFAKVVVRNLETYKIIPWNHILYDKSSSHFLKTSVGYDKNGQFKTSYTSKLPELSNPKICILSNLKSKILYPDDFILDITQDCDYLSKISSKTVTPQNVSQYYSSAISSLTMAISHQIYSDIKSKGKSLQYQDIDWTFPLPYSRSEDEKVKTLENSYKRGIECFTRGMSGDIKMEEIQEVECVTYSQNCVHLRSESLASIAAVTFNSGSQDPLIIFDIGAGTIESLAFKVLRDGKSEIHVCRSDPYGVETLKSQNLLQNETLTPEGERKIQKCIAHTIIAPIKETDNDFYDKTGSLNIYLVGGGSNVTNIKSAIQDTWRVHKHERNNIPKYSLCEIKDVVKIPGIEDSEIKRYTVAVGLSIPDNKLRNIQLPDQLDGYSTHADRHQEYEEDRDKREGWLNPRYHG